MSSSCFNVLGQGRNTSASTRIFNVALISKEPWGMDLQGHSDAQRSPDDLFWAELMIGRITAPKLDLFGIGRLSFLVIKECHKLFGSISVMAVNRKTDENGKPIVVVGNDYSWVNGEVRDLPSLFLDVESIEELSEPSSFVREGSGVKLRFLPCGGQERVYFRGLGWEYFYMYTTVFIDIGIRFPFTEFECGVLNQLKCALTQIHPNAWAFIRGYEILMEYLGTTPLLEVFFSFFQAKGVRKGGVVTVNSMQGKALFGLYRQSYKDFKQMYVKVGCVEEQFPFYLDEFGLERFPLYWYSEPVQILGMAKISRESARIVEFLEEFVEKTELLSLTMLFKWEKEREYEELKAREETERKKEESLLVQKSLELERELKAATEQSALRGKEIEDLKADKKEAKTSKEDHGYDMMAAGFERTCKQAQFLFPDIKFDVLDPVKVVHNGALIDDDEVNMEGGDDHNLEDGGN
ncbi:hypothetical protein PIB30_005790 [Stylosanthes scabra]|uniref:Transposase (putative) gypsy type domain-containing protein n=1 Tax=Stylosanthes scabra TaxID=79078 RepID=A0ABU6X1Y7_9FABA|nr:hypothetical protein [Stylosanthes scabra]